MPGQFSRSLYGHNLSLFKEIGDGVDTRGMLVQTAHNSEHQQVGVYIELR